VKVKLYVTRWVLARGILRMDAELGRRKGQARTQKDWYSLNTGEWDRYRRHWVCLGKDAFLTLDEAKAEARRVFEEAASGAAERARQLSVAVQDLDRLQVHDVTHGGPNISLLHAFERGADYSSSP